VPPRALASATISFGLVPIPVKLCPAGESADRLAFHWLHEKCGSRLKIQYFCPKDREVVPRKEMVKGYEVAKGRYGTFTARELEALDQVSTQTIEVEEFLPAEAIDRSTFPRRTTSARIREERQDTDYSRRSFANRLA
jgi:DNA end-binding protein Ku